MQQRQISLIFYCGLLAGSCLCFWNGLQDATLLPRLVFALVWLLAFTPFWWKNFAGKELKADIPDLLFLAYVIFHALSIFQAINKPEAVYETEKEFLIFICYLIFKAGLRQQLITEQALLKTVAVICVGYGFYAVSQLLQLLQVAKPEGDNLYAINALSGHKNLYSGIIFMASCLLGILALTEKKAWKYLALALIIFHLVIIFILQTRSVFISVIVAAIILITGGIIISGSFKLSFIKKAALPVAGLIAVVAVFFIASGSLASVAHRLNISNYFTSDTGSERLALWYKSYYMLRDHWLMGVGANNWMLVYPYYTFKGIFRMLYLNLTFLQPHNDFIWIWCELGILGLIAFIALLGSFIRRAVNGISQSTEFNLKAIFVLLLAQQIGFVIFSFFDFPKARIEHQVILVLSWAIVSYRSSNTVYSLSMPPLALKGFFITTTFILLISAIGINARMHADTYMQDMLDADARHNPKEVIELAQTMQTPFSNLTPIAMPKVWYEGVAAYSLQQYQHAYDCFKLAKTQSPYNPNVLNNLGGMQTYFKKYDEALSTYTETLRINEKNDDARFNVAYTLYQLHRYNEALDSVAKVWSNKPRKEEFQRVIKSALDSSDSVSKR